MKIFLRIAAAVMLPGAVACTSETALNIENNLSDGSGGEGAVRFSLSVPSSPATRAVGDEVAASDDEKSVSSLYAVLFRDADASGSVADKGQEDDGDVFFKMIDVLDLKDGGAYSEDTGSSVDGVTTTDTYTLPVSTGSYQIVFVANSDGSLKASLDALKEGSSTVKDFKNTVCAQAPDSKYDSSSSETSPGLLMVSDFYGAVVKTEETTSLAKNEDGIVYLERVMARIDIVNKASGITITDVTFSNRAVKTALVSDSPAFTSDYVEASKTYTLNLTGDSSVSDDAETNKYKANIYSYEQYGTGDDAPSLSISYKYTIEGVTTTGTQEVKFEKSTSSEGGDGSAVTEQINLRRNHLYTVIVSNSAGRLRFTLTVADWNSGETFEVANDWLRTGMIDYSGIELGDVMFSDGTWADVSALTAAGDTLTAAQKAKAVGIVAYLYSSSSSQAGSGVSAALAGKFTTPHGLVLALKYANTAEWGLEKAVGTLYPNDATTKTVGEALAGAFTQDGLTMTNYILKVKSSEIASYPAFNDIAAYEKSASAPVNSTGWYLPGIGDLVDMFGGDGIGAESSIKTFKLGIENSSSATAKLNAALKVVGEGNYNKIENKPFLWSSSENSAKSAYGVRLYDDMLTVGFATKSNGNYTMGGMQTRYVFAF